MWERASETRIIIIHENHTAKTMKIIFISLSEFKTLKLKLEMIKI